MAKEALWSGGLVKIKVGKTKSIIEFVSNYDDE